MSGDGLKDGDFEFERIPRLAGMAKRLFINPWINYLIPRKILLSILKNSECRMLHASLEDPGGWKSMCLAYEDGEPKDLIDKLVCRLGAFPMALRNRKRLASKVLAELFDSYPPDEVVNVVEVGSGCGHNSQEAMRRARHKKVRAYCIDLAEGAFEYGREMARVHGHEKRVKFIAGNVLDIRKLIDVPSHIITTIGILEYLTDEQILDILGVLHADMPGGGRIIANSIYSSHGTDRFLRTILNLHLTYRSTEEVMDLMRKVGFCDFSVEAEPLGVYKLIVGRKD